MKYSVLLSVYSKENPQWLKESLDSVYQQTLPPDEVVLVKDGPLTDELEGIIAQYPQLVLVPLPQNQGLGIALHEGLLHCSYELVARMDTDDIALPYRFEHQVKQFVEHPELSVASGHINEFIDTVDNVVGRRVLPIGQEACKHCLKRRDPLNHMAVMFRKSEVIRAGNYQPWHFNEDSYLWLRMLLAGCTFDNLDEVLVNARVGMDMYARRGGWRYFKSEAGLQHLRLKSRVISPMVYIVNLSMHFVVKVLMPNSVRAYVFQKLLRK